MSGWRQSPKARQGKSKARVKAYEELADKATDTKTSRSQIIIPIAERLGGRVLRIENINKTFNDKVLIKDLSLTVPRGAIVGIIGANGAGKTTFFNILTTQESPDSGTIEWGESVKLGHVTQTRDSLNRDATVYEEISGGLDELQLGKTTIHSRAYCSAFNFKGTEQQKKVSMLSGGESNRLHLAKTLLYGHNFLLLDEPTNDLDVETLQALEQALEEYAGCAMIISHDRWFLDRITTHILAFEGDSHVEWFEGNYQDYEADKIRRLGGAATLPQRIKYKKLTRAQ